MIFVDISFFAKLVNIFCDLEIKFMICQRCVPNIPSHCGLMRLTFRQSWKLCRDKRNVVYILQNVLNTRFFQEKQENTKWDTCRLVRREYVHFRSGTLFHSTNWEHFFYSSLFSLQESLNYQSFLNLHFKTIDENQQLGMSVVRSGVVWSVFLDTRRTEDAFTFSVSSMNDIVWCTQQGSNYHHLGSLAVLELPGFIPAECQTHDHLNKLCACTFLGLPTSTSVWKEDEPQNFSQSFDEHTFNCNVWNFSFARLNDGRIFTIPGKWPLSSNLPGWKSNVMTTCLSPAWHVRAVQSETFLSAKKWPQRLTEDCRDDMNCNSYSGPHHSWGPLEGAGCDVKAWTCQLRSCSIS